MDHLFRSVAAEVADKNIKVLTVNPYVFASEMADRVSSMASTSVSAFASMVNPSQQLGTPEQLGELVVKLLTGQLPQYASGANVAVDADTHFPVLEALPKAAEMAKKQNQEKK